MRELGPWSSPWRNTGENAKFRVNHNTHTYPFVLEINSAFARSRVFMQNGPIMKLLHHILGCTLYPSPAGAGGVPLNGALRIGISLS